MHSTSVLFGGMRPILTTSFLHSPLFPPSHQTQGTRWFLIFAGAILGVTAALLWSAQGCIMMSYPLEGDKGKAFGIFWAIFQFGSFIGAIIALAINLRQGHLDAVATSTYIVSSSFSGVAKFLSSKLANFPSPSFHHYRPSWSSSSSVLLPPLRYCPHIGSFVPMGLSSNSTISRPFPRSSRACWNV